MATTWTCLIRIKNKDDEQSHLIEKTSFTIGRAEDAGFPLAEPSVSRTHLTVELRGPFVYITDMKSGNGTRVNGQKIAGGVAIAVTANDVIQLGRASLDFQILSIPKPIFAEHAGEAVVAAPIPAPVQVASAPSLPAVPSIAVRAPAPPVTSVAPPVVSAPAPAPVVAPKVNVPSVPTAAPAHVVVAKVPPVPQVPVVAQAPAVPQIPPALANLHNQKQALELEIAELKQTLAVAASEERLKYAAQADQLINDAHKKVAKDYQEASEQIDMRMRAAQEKLFSMTQDAEARARQTIQEAQDEAVRIRVQATDETRKIHQEALQRNSETLSTLQEKFQADMNLKRDDMIARAKAEGERERAKALKARTDEATAIEKTIASLNATLQPLHDKQKAAVEELKRIDELTTQARRELERDSKNADDVRSWVARTSQAKLEKAEIEKALAHLQARLVDAQSKVDEEVASIRQKTLLEFENEKKHSQGDLAKTKLKALEEVQKRIQEEERKYGETLHIRAVELAQKISARLIPALPDLIKEPDIAGARMKEAIESAANEVVLHGKSSFTAPIVGGLAVPLATRDEKAKRQRMIGAAIAIVVIAVLSIYGHDIYNYSKAAEVHSYASEKMQERQEAAVYHPDQDPRYGTTYRESYAENVLFMKGYYEAKTDSLNQQKWLLRLNDLDLLRPMHLSEDDIVAYISKENALISRLASLQSKIDGVYAEQGLKTMTDAENDEVVEMKKILKSEANYKKIRALERDFAKQLIR